MSNSITLHYIFGTIPAKLERLLPGHAPSPVGWRRDVLLVQPNIQQ